MTRLQRERRERERVSQLYVVQFLAKLSKRQRRTADSDRTFHELEGKLMENKPWRLVDLSVVTQTRDAESKEESYHDVAEPATGYSNLVNPRLPKNTQDREIFQDRNLDAIWVKPFSLSLSLPSIPIEPTIPRESSPRAREKERGGDEVG